MSRVHRSGIVIASVVLVAVLGCGKTGPALVLVRGTVSLDDRPLAEGTISFKTIQTGITNTLPVKDGKFEGSVMEGERHVEINAYRSRPVSGPMGGEVQESLIARRYNLDSQLTATVAPGEANEFKFTVHSK